MQDLKQLLARDPREALTARANRATAIVHVDVVPVDEARDDPLVRRGIRGCDVAERLIGEDDTPTEGVVGPIALEHDDVGAGLRSFQDDRKKQPRGSAADADDSHNAPGWKT